jgi:NitT/TauT family transport system substrate-binding protein
MTVSNGAHRLTRRDLLGYGSLAVAAAPALAWLLEACGGSQQSRPAGGGIPFNFNLGFVPQGRNAPFYYGVKQGLYAKRNLDVTIAPASGTGAALQQLSAGKTQLVITDLTYMLRLMGQVPRPLMKSFATLYAKQLSTIFFFADGPIKTPKDLEGKTIATSAGSNEYLLFPLFAKANGIDPSLVRWKVVDASVKTGLLLSGGVDATSTLLFGLAQLEAGARGRKIGYFLYGDHGVAGGAAVLAGTDDYAKAHPDAVRGFVQASMEAFKEAFARPEAAVDAMAEAVPTLDRSVAMAEMKLLPQVVVGPAQRQHGLGWNDPGVFSATYDQVVNDFKQPIGQPPATFFTNEFVGDVKA